MKYALSNSLNGAGGLYKYDSDALAYITAVETADAQPLETGVKIAINNFVKGCKSDAIWDAIKASCILAGARTLSGAIVPLKGTAPTSNNFVSGDYNRKTGLKGDGATKYLNSNRGNNIDPQNNKHNAVFTSSIGTIPTCFLGVGDGTSSGSDQLLIVNTSVAFISRNRGSGTSFQTGPSGSLNIGFYGNNRNSSTLITSRANSTNYTASSTSSAPDTNTILVFARGSSASPITLSSGSISFYSIGESINLAALESRVSTLMSNLTSAIP